MWRERFLKAFDARIALLSKFSEIGHPKRFRAAELKNIRFIPIGERFKNHLIFYTTTGETVSIERVMHGARDLERRLLEPPDNFFKH